jgi:hypothetical protein
MLANFRVLILCAGLVFSSAAQAATDWSAVDAMLGRSGTLQSGGVHRYGFPRSDLQVTVDGIPIRPSLALGGWVAFQPAGDSTMVMGDLVLTETEINPVLTKLMAGGMAATAIHNHLLRAQPATFYMHVAGHGEPLALAKTLREALAVSATPMAAPASQAAPMVDLDTAALDSAIGTRGQSNGGVYQFGVSRDIVVREHGAVISPAMGLATVINFQPLGGRRTAITGDFVTLPEEVGALLRTLRANGIEVTAVHSHMLDEQPRLFFIHFWAADDAVKLAKGLRAGLEAAGQKPQ